MQRLSSSSVVCTSGLTRRHLPPGRIATSAWMWSASLGRKRKKIAKEPLEDCERWTDLMWDRETWVLLCCISQSLEVSLFCHEVLGKRREDRKFHLCGLTSCAKFRCTSRGICYVCLLTRFWLVTALTNKGWKERLLRHWFKINYLWQVVWTICPSNVSSGVSHFLGACDFIGYSSVNEREERGQSWQPFSHCIGGPSQQYVKGCVWDAACRVCMPTGQADIFTTNYYAEITMSRLSPRMALNYLNYGGITWTCPITWTEIWNVPATECHRAIALPAW